MAWPDEAFSWDSETWVRKIAAAMRWPGGAVNADTLLAGRSQRCDFPGETPVQFKTAMPQTPDGKIHFTFAALEDDPYRYTPVENARYPLAFISPANNKMVSSTFGEFNYPEIRLRMNPRDAAARGIAEGHLVRVFNDLGEVQCRAELSDRIREGVVSIPKGAWRKASRNGQTATALCPATTGTAGGACYNDARVEVSRL
jgi:anaerobic selenocysteine-containing dehydrogenase